MLSKLSRSGERRVGKAGRGELMETLRSHLSKVRIPEPSNRINKQECCVSFSTPRSEGGLFVDMCTFLAFGKEYVTWNYVKTGDPIYLNIQETRKQVSENRPHKKSTLLAIGGFYSREQEYKETYSIVILPHFISLPYPSVELPEKVRLAVDGVLAAVGEKRKEVVAAWTADKKQVSPYFLALQQLRNAVTVPPTGWKCSKCDKTENLWMNLTDGAILCGRRNWDWSGGNNHALEHYQETRYPLAVKLGTVTDDLEEADVYSDAEDDAVEDPFLADHLAHFGIDFSTLRKTEMTTAERDLDQNINFDWKRIQENGKELEPLFGPGFTGLSNLGNSYYENVKLEDAFKQAPADPTRDLQMQLSKLAHGLLSGKYSVPLTTGLESEAVEGPKDKNALTTLFQGQEGIPPRMFKSLIGTGHPEFASFRQQDALQFFQHLLDQVEKSHAADAREDPSRCFKFCVEERIMCSVTKKVKYTWKTDNVLSLNVPLRAAVNKDEVAAYEKRVAEKELAGEKFDEEIVCPRVPLAACFKSYSAPEEVQDFYSSAINARTTAIKILQVYHQDSLLSIIFQPRELSRTTLLATFPDYLVLHMKKFMLEAGGVPKKRDVFVDVPDEIDISNMRSSGLKPDEQLLPEMPDEIPEQAGPPPDQAIVSLLADTGFPRVRCEKAAVQTLNRGLEEAMDWLLPHTDDPDIDEPSIRTRSSRASSAAPVNETDLETLVYFGFPSEMCLKALTATGGDVERAAEWILNHPEEPISMELDVGTSNRDTHQAVNVANGSGRYQLLAFVSHMGTSTQSGHYVAHVRKNDRWVIFNDNKVALSGDPPKDKGYLYFFQRIPS